MVSVDNFTRFLIIAICIMCTNYSTVIKIFLFVCLFVCFVVVVCLSHCIVLVFVAAGPASIKCAGQGNKPPYPAGGMSK